MKVIPEPRHVLCAFIFKYFCYLGIEVLTNMLSAS